MYPEFDFSILGTAVELKSFALFTGLGALAGILTALPLLKREGMPVLRAVLLLLCMAGAFLAGARLLNFAVNYEAYGKSLHIYSLRLTGLSLYGGIAGAMSALLIWAQIKKQNVWALLDALVLPTGLAFAIARLGCFLNGCCSGMPTASRWGLAFPAEGGPISGLLSLLGQESISVYLFPTQLFEMGLALIGLIPVLWLYFRKKQPHGAVFLMYGIWFSAMRLTVLSLRSLPYPEIVTHIIYPSFYLALIISGLIVLRSLYRKATHIGNAFHTTEAE